MNKIHHKFILIFFCLISQCAFAKNPGGWTRSYEEAVERSQGSKKPMLLYFTGSDWSGWCTKLNQEVFDTEDFHSATHHKFVFVLLDFPIRNPLPEQEQAQNERLREKFSIRSFPTVLLLDDQQRVIGVTGYRPGGGKQYANHLLKMTQDYATFRQKIDDLKTGRLSGKELKRLYQKARELAMDEDAHQVLKMGLLSDQKQYFLTEKYRRLAEEGLIHEDEAIHLKQQLLANDPHNNQLTHYQVAVIEFETFSSEMARDGYDVALAIAPLENYISRFGKHDPENLWRLQMLISQVYLDHNDTDKALEHAEAAYLSAPTTIQPDIAEAVLNIQNLSSPHIPRR